VQSRIATPEGFVVVFSLAAVYAFYRFLIAAQVEERVHTVVPPWAFAAGVLAGLCAGAAVVGIWDGIWAHMKPPGVLDRASSIIIGLYVAIGVYLVLRYLLFRAWFADGATESTYPDGSYALTRERSVAVYAPDGGTIESGGGKAKITAGALSQNRGGALVYTGDEFTLNYRPVPSVEYETPAATATYAENEIRCEGSRERGASATLWLIVFTIALGLLVSSKWYGVMGFGVSFVALILVWLQRTFANGRPALWGNPRGFRLDGALATIVFISMTVYGLVWIPDLVRQSPDQGEIHNFNDVVFRQYSMFMYHDQLKATHPYSSKWFEWPIDYVPIAYYYQDHRKDIKDPAGCCVEEITSIPNPITMWLGLIAVPIVGVLAWLRRNKGYALIVLTYLLQWLPWMRSPRITFAYHFYVDIPLICLCNVILMQAVWLRFKDKPDARRWALGGITLAVVAIVVSFVFFYPILAAIPITWNQWHARMWMPTWIIGPG
jgi:dolichyl-phosphate-mannose--protein O-mannosyl transferase